MFIKTKSPETYFLINKALDMLLAEQRHQRADLATVKRQLHTLINSSALQKQVDSYFEDSKQEEIENGNSSGN